MPNEPEDGGNVHDGAATCCLQRRRRQLATQEGSLGIDIQGPVPFLFDCLVEGFEDEDAGIVDKDVKLAEFMNGVVQRTPPVVRPGGVMGDEARGTPGVADLLGHRFPSGFPDVREDDLGAFCGEEQCVCPAHAMRRSGDDCDFS